MQDISCKKLTFDRGVRFVCKQVYRKNNRVGFSLKMVANNNSAHGGWSFNIHRAFDVLIPSLKRIASVAAMSGMVLYTSTVSALGVGAATIDSFIGERLSLTIPLFNVDNSDSLAVQLLSSSLVSEQDSALKARIERANNQLAIVVSTEWLVNEPYISFELQVNDQNNSLTKEFTILLNLAPGSSLASSSNQSGSGVANNSDSSTLLNSSQVQVESLSGDGSVLGPYDWAKAGNIPAKFGAVIDGQSLWRVARRINKALGVSVDQMMVALYEKNPNAFSTSSIDSLQAGSFLDIPSYAAATQLTEVQAQARVLELSGSAVSAQPRETQSEFSTPTQVAAEPSVDADSVMSEDSTESPSEASPSQQSFQMTGISEAGRSTASGEETVEESQEIISSLAATVGNLTQELIRKDKKIQFLEDRVEVLESISGTSPTSEVGTENSEALPDNQVESIASVSTSSAKTPSSSWLSGISIWWWLLGLVAALGVLFRNRIASLFSDLNLFGSDDDLDFQEPGSNISSDNDYSVLSAIQKARGDNELDGVSFHEIEESSFAEEERELLSIEKAAAAKGLPPVEDLSVEEYLTVAMEDDGDFPVGASVSEDDIINDDDFTVHDLDYFADEESEEDDDGADLAKPGAGAVEFETYETNDLADTDGSFDQRIEKLLEDKDYGFARELLDFARHNEIDNERYHFERLRLYLAMDDEDGFYDYYQTIEAQIVEFDDQLQKSIAKLVTTLG